MPALSPQALAPFLAQYGNATVATVLDSLGLGAEEVGSGVSPESLWRQPGVAERLLGDPATAERLDARRQEQRALLLHYLDQNGVLAQSRIAAADVGWRGTIEDNLARLLPEHRLDGYYLALFPAFSPAPSNAGKTGFVLDAQSPYALTRRLRFVAPLEFICSDRALSAVAYARNLCEVTPVYDMLQVVPADSPAFRCLQDGVSEGVVSMGTLGRPDAGEASMLLLDLIERPPAALAALYFQAWRDDRYGAGTLHRDAPRIDLRQVLAALVSRKARRSLGLAMADSGWPWALLVRDLNPLAPLVRRLVLALDARL